MQKILALFAVVFLLAACDNGTGNTIAGPTTITSSATGVTLGLRGKNGQKFVYICPSNITFESVWGTDVYTDDSRICSAAVHFGKITQGAGGAVTIEIAAGLSSYAGSVRNGVSSANWDSWPGSYVFK